MPRAKGGKRRLQAVKAAAAKKTKQVERVVSCSNGGLSKCSDPQSKCAFRRKHEAMDADEDVADCSDQLWSFTHVFQLTRLLSDLTCPVCKETGLSITVSEGENAGFASQRLLPRRINGCVD
ncbi:hypothetical protein V1264_022197 [Littorina saxatilis]|uniref:Uncharacterized protein n=1 Tax=Littorina saxatilis TaxID=31220 RepID=A0AAN9FX41_9CAEN